MAVCTWCVWGSQKTITDVSHYCSLPCPLRQDLSLNLEFSDLVNWLKRSFFIFASPPPRAGVTGNTSGATIFMWVQRIPAWVLRLVRWPLYPQAPPPPYSISIQASPPPYSISIQWPLYPQAPPPLYRYIVSSEVFSIPALTKHRLRPSV